MPKIHNLTGLKFGRLLVISRHGSNNNSKPTWNCKCDCGNDYISASPELKNGQCKSCGCLQRDLLVIKNTTHGNSSKSNSDRYRTYQIWYHMIQRCYNLKNAWYPNYGGRGITICNEWRYNFDQFINDMGFCPLNMTIDRINNNDGYNRINCQWVTNLEQQKNKTTNRLIEFEGISYTLGDFAKIIGTHRENVRRHLNQGKTPQQIKIYFDDYNLQ